jgi:hypothetical protein
MAKRKREGQTTQWPKEKEKDRQHNGQKKKAKTINNDRQSTIQKIKDRGIRTSLRRR